MTIDLTSVVSDLIGTAFTLLLAVMTYLINSRLKDKQAASTLAAAVQNSIGMAHQVSVGAVQAIHPSVEISGISPAMATAIQYVVDHAGAEMTRFGISQEAIAEKVTAQQGLTALIKAPAPVVVLPSSTGEPPLPWPNPAKLGTP